MRLIGDVIVSDEVLETHFRCNIAECRGNCCRFGDLGAPVSEIESVSINEALPEVFSILPKKNTAFLSAGATEVYRSQLHIREIAPNHPCPFGFFKRNDDVISCSLHHVAVEKNALYFKVKPLWCSLFPLMVKKVLTGWTLNMHLPNFCRSISPAPPILLAFQEPLTYLFGENWMKEAKKLFV